jgi:ketosteroid isomerase-like protein
MRRFVLAAFALTVLAACQPATTELTDYEKAEIAAEVELLHGQFWDAWRAWDFERGMSYYTNSPEFMFANEDQIVRGWDALNEGAQAMDVESQTITFAESHTAVLASGVVQVVERGTYAVTNTEGESGPEHSFTCSATWVHQNSEWKVQFFHLAETTPENP